MTTYTTPHSMPIFAATDKIAASDDGLRQDLNAISTAAAAAITAEGGRAEGAANTYTDGKDTSNRAAWAAADVTNLAAANTYTDGKDTSNRAAWAAADVTNLAAAKTYTDAGLAVDRERLTSIEAKNTRQETRLDSLEAVAPKISNIAIDSDGNPYFSPGSTEVHVIPDTDGQPYYISFLSASADADGNPYF